MSCYHDSDPYEAYNIVDEKGKKAGFSLFVEEMMQRLSDQGACFYPYHELTSLAKIDAPGSPLGFLTELYFANGVTATTLNLPQRPLLSIVRNSALGEQGMLDRETSDALYYPSGSVFWYKLGLLSGDFGAVHLFSNKSNFCGCSASHI